MIPPRPTPFDLVFGAEAGALLAPIAAGIEAAQLDARDRDGFLLLRETAELLQRLRPSEGLGTGVELLAAFLHHAYLFWKDGEQVTSVGERRLAELLHQPAGRPTIRQTSRYIQLPALRVWATLAGAVTPEPLDGWFVGPAREDLCVLAVFGLNPARAGFSAVEVSGPPPGVVQRPDGSAPFLPLLEGGRAAGLVSLSDGDELLELAWREASA
jgi:hypothetical protein